MTVNTLLRTISSKELNEWKILYKVRAVERELAMLKARGKGSQR